MPRIRSKRRVLGALCAAPQNPGYATNNNETVHLLRPVGPVRAPEVPGAKTVAKRLRGVEAGSFPH